MASDEGEDTTKVRRRNRRVASCNPCRAKRSRCDRGRPCSACIERGSQSSCTWDATALQPVYERREANQTEALRNEVDRLQRLVDVLVSAQPPQTLSNPSPLPLPSTPSYLSQTPRNTSASLDASTSAPSTVSDDAPLTVDELETDDIVEKLSELTIKTFQLPSHEAERSSTHALVEEAQNLLDAAAPFPSDSTASPAGRCCTCVFAAPLSRDGITLEEIAQRVPPKEMVDEAVEAYFDGLAFYLHPITRKQLDHHLQLVFPSPSPPSSSAPSQLAAALSLAIVLGITSLGLFSGDGTSTCYSTYSRSSLPAQMIELARNALALSETVEGPSLDSIRALLIVGGHYIAGGSGDEGRKGVSTVTLAANACLQLGLHRDPDSKPNSLSFAEKEDRRRLYHLVLHEEAVLARLLGRRFVLLHSNHSDTRLPLDIHDDELEKEGPPADREAGRAAEEETLMSAVLVRMKLAQLSRRITEEVFSVQPAGYTRVLELDIKIRQLQNEMPLRYQPGGGADSPLTQLKAAGIQLMYLHEILRLHRPYALHSMRSGEEDKYAFSRKVCIETALLVLERHNPPDLQACIPCMLHCLILAATVLSVDLMYDLDNPDAQRRKSLVRAVIPRLERFKAISTVCRRGIALLTFLLDKLNAVSRSFRLTDEDSPFFKRSRPDVGAAWSPRPAEAPLHAPDLARKVPSRSSSLPSLPTAAEQPLPPPSHRGLSLPFSSTPRTIRPMPLPRRRDGGEPGPSSDRGPSPSGLPIPPAPLSAFPTAYPPPPPPPPPLPHLDHLPFPAPSPAPSLSPAPATIPTEIASFDFAAIFAPNNGAVLPYDSGDAFPQRQFGQFERRRYDGGGGEGEGRREGER